MLFNSIGYAIFLPIVFILYWCLSTRNYKYQNILLLIASYFFYACWDWRFLFLLVFSTLLDYITGLKMSGSGKKRVKTFWFWISVSVNLGFLALFKYYNFFINSFSHLLEKLGLHTNPWVLNVILPVGISFYTFHGLSYVIDIYKGKIKAERNFIDYSLFVSFFPLLVAGPIERATHLLPQLKQNRTFKYAQAVDGLRQILWGLFKKIVIADQCAVYANLVFNHSADYSGSTHVLGAVFFAFQIYGDFSGYSDIALGTARLFGIELLQNFAFPYFSRDIAEFWRRWHISLATWFKDYLYIPLGGSRAGTWIKIRNILIIFMISGFWHGANWTYLAWGLLNAIYIIPSVIFKTHRNNLDVVAHGKAFPSIKEGLSMLITFGLTVFAWIFFRSANVTDAVGFVVKICSKSIFTLPQAVPSKSILLIILFLCVEWMGRAGQYAIQSLFLKRPTLLRWGFYSAIILFIMLFNGPQKSFIYFQF